MLHNFRNYTVIRFILYSLTVSSPATKLCQEIVSGAQRIHDLEFLKERAREKGIPLDSITSYLNAFKHGAEPHGEGYVSWPHLDRVKFPAFVRGPSGTKLKKSGWVWYFGVDN